MGGSTQNLGVILESGGSMPWNKVVWWVILLMIGLMATRPIRRIGRAILLRDAAALQYGPRALFIPEPLDCSLSLPLRLGIPYPHNPEPSFPLLVFNP